MKKILLAPIMCAMTAASPLLGQTTMSFSGPSVINLTKTNTFTLSVNLSFSGYNAGGLSYWLEVQNALAPFLTITGITHFTFPGSQTAPVPIPPIRFTVAGASGYGGEPVDLGASVQNPFTMSVPPGTHQVTDLTFTLAPGTPPGMYNLRSTTVSPRISEVTDTNFNDNNVFPAGTFTINIVLEPSKSP